MEILGWVLGVGLVGVVALAVAYALRSRTERRYVKQDHGPDAVVLHGVGTEERSTPFRVRDTTGSLLVRPARIEIMGNVDSAAPSHSAAGCSRRIPPAIWVPPHAGRPRPG